MPFNFTPFYNTFKDFYPHHPLPSSSFLEWFIGFTEGDGSFILSKRGDLSFVLTQSTNNIKLLNYVKKHLIFGKVLEQSKNQKTHRYVVQDTQSLFLLSLLFNGNMVLPTRNARFLVFLSKLNESLLRRNLFYVLPPNIHTILPTLSDSWLSGFTEAEGCFTVSLLSHNTAFRFCFLLSQKWDVNLPVLQHILDLFNSSFSLEKPIGVVTPHSQPFNWDLKINGLKNCKLIFHYFDSHPFVSNKLSSYLRWKYLHFCLENQEHLDPEKRRNLIQLSKEVNKF